MSTLSTAAFYERSTLQMASLRRRAETLQSQVGSGERLERSSDDPVAAARLRGLDRQERLASVDQVSSDRAAADLRLADSALSAMADIAIRARELALRARNGALSDRDLAAIGTEMAQLRDGLLALANARSASGQALFGGETAGPAYVASGGTVAYAGTAQVPRSDLGEGQEVPRSVTGPEALSFTGPGGATDLFAELGSLAAALSGGGAGAVAAAGDALVTLETGLEKITTAQTVIGTRLAFIETLDNRRAEAGELRAAERAETGGADLALTITRLKEVLGVLEASQASFVKLAGLSLFNQLR